MLRHFIPSSRHFSPSSLLMLATTTVRFASSSAASSTNPQQHQANFYQRLGVPRTASHDEIKKRYKQRALECHPDMVPAAQKSRAEVEFRHVAEAYETLSDERRRRRYDAKTFGDDVGMSRRQQQESTTATQQKRSSSASTAASAAEPKSEAKTRRASSSFSSSQHKSRGTSRPTSRAEADFRASQKKRQQMPFLSKDAQRVFREAFEGKTVHDVLFAEAYQNRYGRHSNQKLSREEGNKKSSSNKGDGEDAKNSGSNSSVDGDQRQTTTTTTTTKKYIPRQWSQLVEQVKDQLRDEFKRKHPYADPRDMRIGVSRAFHQPDEPPGDAFPFRKCDSLRFPDNVSPGQDVKPTEVGETVPADTEVLHVSDVPMSSYRDGENFRGEAGKILDPATFSETVDGYRHPKNEGVTYSFRRQY